MRTLPALHRLAQRIENAEQLDPLGQKLNSMLSAVPRPAPVEDVLSGTPLGHPLHPALVAVPMGAWMSGRSAGRRPARDDAATRLVALGLLAAVPAAATGASDWLTTNSAERRVGLVHALLNYAGIGAYTISWTQRRKGNRTRRRGHVRTGVVADLARRLAGRAPRLRPGRGRPTPRRSRSSRTSGRTRSANPRSPRTAWRTSRSRACRSCSHVPGAAIAALADRCTHRGAPLHEGELRDGCVHCPWHDSIFDLTDGQVVSGPATRPQPVLQTRVQDGRVQVRRSEERALRSNVVGH